ncbi:MAG: galactose-1-epimerase, partial [Lachnospiraceae bacterium]|nr:galactose-1-epimerase [Lachnospiraceae bacterium]
MGMTKSVFGKTSNGEVVHLVTVSNEKGMSMEVLDY